jgi:hypothetical protein
MNDVVVRTSEIDLTEATKFVLPMLYTKDRTDEFFITKNFENCYIGDRNKEELGQGIFLLYNYKVDVKFVKFERSLELIPEYQTDYDYSNENQVMFVYNIPEQFTDDFEHFKLGNFHLFSDEYKQQILKFWGIEKTNSFFYKTLYPETEVALIENPINLDSEYYTSPQL